MSVQPAKDVVGRLSASPERLKTETAGIQSAMTDSPNGIRSSPPVLAGSAMDVDPPNASPDDVGGKSDSEAETIVLPGKDGHSPSKVRKSIKHEDKSDEEMSDAKNLGLDNAPEIGKPGSKRNTNDVANSTQGKRKRLKPLNHEGDSTHHGNSSGLSSVPTSPLATAPSTLSKPAVSESEVSKSPSPHPQISTRDKAKSVDRALPRKRAHDADSEEEDDIDARRAARPRSGTKTHFDGKARKALRSQSPQTRGHRRSISTQLPAKSSHGLSHKKKRVPVPLQSTEYHSDDSSGSGNSFPRSSRLRSLAAPNTGDSTMSPAKMPHRKHVNSSGQTQFLRACGQNKLKIAKERYEEFPEDLNQPDNANNTPLHAASLDGHVDIVKFLLGTGKCEVDPLNDAKDTPLHDALENGHTEVVKLLLDAGANPRKQKADGKDALDIIGEEEKEARDDDDEEAIARWAKMRRMVASAIKNFVQTPQDSENIRDSIDSRMSHPIESPRHTPPIPSREFSGSTAAMRRVGVSTSRQVKTKDGNLYQPMTVNELRKAAEAGDSNKTGRILEVLGDVNDVKSVWLAARGGYDEIVNLHLALGGYEVTSEPLDDADPRQGTPFLVAIGRANSLKVLRLFLAQSSFDPTRLTEGDTYYDVARKRKGPNWQEEVTLLKEAYDSYKPPKISPTRTRSPGMRKDTRDNDRDHRRSQRSEEQAPRSHKRKTSSPKMKESEAAMARHRRNSSLDQSKDGQPKRGPGRPPKRDDTSASAALSDQEATRKTKAHQKRSESDMAAVSDTETTTKPRRKLVSGKEYRIERGEKQRRASIASNVSSASVKEKRDRGFLEAKSEKPDGRTSPTIARSNSKHTEHDTSSDRNSLERDRARSLKRDDSKDRLSAIRGESPVKRPRKSETPPRSSAQDDRGPPKRRKLEGDSNRKVEGASSSSPEHQSKPKHSMSRDSSAVRSNDNKPNRASKGYGEITKEGKRPAHEDQTPNRSGSSSKYSHSSTPESLGKLGKTSQSRSSEKSREMSPVTLKANKDEAAKEKRLQREKEEKAAARRLEEEREEAARIEEAKQARLAREKAAREEEEQREREEAERKERQRREDAEARARALEQQRALYLEQERIKREEQERRRALAQEQQRAEKARLEKQKREEHLSKLPYLLRWFDEIEDPKASEIASLFRTIQGYRYDTINPENCGKDRGKEQWMLNTHVATLLGEKDLQLSRYPAWERVALSEGMKKGVWKSQNDWFTLQHYSLPSSIRQCFPRNEVPPHKISEHNEALFLDLDLFFVKVSEFLFVVPNFPHLRAIEMEVQYKELDVSLSKAGPIPAPRWQYDPDVTSTQTFSPASKIYVDGRFVRDVQIQRSKLLNVPPGDDRVPRRGFVRVFPGESDYEDLCRQQGLHDLVHPFSPKLNGLDSRPQANHFTPPGSDKSPNGESPSLGSEARVTQGLSNGIASPSSTAPGV